MIILNSVEKIIKKRISIENVIETLMDVDKLKHVCLTADELNLFKYIPNPSVFTVNGEERNDKWANQKVKNIEQLQLTLEKYVNTQTEARIISQLC